jgi:hypothetical protein
MRELAEGIGHRGARARGGDWVQGRASSTDLGAAQRNFWAARWREGAAADWGENEREGRRLIFFPLPRVMSCLCWLTGGPFVEKFCAKIDRLTAGEQKILV